MLHQMQQGLQTRLVMMVHVLQVSLAAGASVKKAAGAVKTIIQKGSLQQVGYSWADPDQYEHEVNILQRFLVDTSLSGGMPIHCTPTSKSRLDFWVGLWQLV